MSSLVIDHGDPWWLSPNVWVVPTSNPSDPSPGEINPVVGQQYYVVANVRNTGAETVSNATVYFWWAVPSLGIATSTNANLIGTSSVTVNAGQISNVLELTPWSPQFQNSGHECVIAAVVEGGGPPPPVLDGANDPAVAQRNLGVVKVKLKIKLGRLFNYPFQVCNPSRVEETFIVAAKQAPLSDIEMFVKALPGEHKTQEQPGEIQRLGFVDNVCPEPADYEHARPILNGIKLAPHSCTGFSLVGKLEGAGPALAHVTQSIGDRIVGGLSVVIITDKGQGHDRNP